MADILPAASLPKTLAGLICWLTGASASVLAGCVLIRLGHAEGAPAWEAEAPCSAAARTAGLPKEKLDLGVPPPRVPCCLDPIPEVGFC